MSIKKFDLDAVKVFELNQFITLDDIHSSSKKSLEFTNVLNNEIIYLLPNKKITIVLNPITKSNYEHLIVSLQKNHNTSFLKFEKRDNGRGEIYFGYGSYYESLDELNRFLQKLNTNIDINVDKTEKVTEVVQLIKTRVGHGALKKKLLLEQKNCKLCGIREDKLLIASHIKPWKDSNSFERFDLNNILLLCPNHDALFDKGLISFDTNGVLLISNSLSELSVYQLNLRNFKNIHLCNQTLLYMKWHRENVFLG